MGSQSDLVHAAFIGTLEQALPFFGGEAGVCPPLAHLVGSEGEDRYKPLIDSTARTGRELRESWNVLVREAEESMAYLGREVENNIFSTAVEEVGQGSTNGDTSVGP